MEFIPIALLLILLVIAVVKSGSSSSCDCTDREHDLLAKYAVGDRMSPEEMAAIRKIIEREYSEN
jgi:hypothetical protein